MAASFDREQLLDALDAVGRAAVAANTRLEIAVYDGSALMLAGNFRFATEDLDVAKIEKPWPDWLVNIVADCYRKGLVGALAQRLGDVSLESACFASARSCAIRHFPPSGRSRARDLRPNGAIHARPEAQGLARL
ncbi:MAG: hypothetical protein WDO17_00470 [Alphaproteobacteria bacterium]